MPEQQKAPPTALEPTKALAPVPRYVDEEEKLAKFAAETNLARMAILDPDKVEKAMNALSRVLKTMREIAIQDTVGIDWTLYRDLDGKEVGVLRDSGAVKVRKWLGISIFNHRHDDGSGKEGPRVWEDTVDEGNGKTKKVLVVSGLVDGYCSRTDEHVTGLPFAVRNEPQEFTGRKHPTTKLSNLTDVLATWRTGADAKVVRVLGGVRKIPKDELVERGVDVKNCYLGRGYGTGSDRAAAGVAAGGLDEAKAKLRTSLLRRTNGAVEDAKKLLVECTFRPANPKKKGDTGFKGLDSVERFTLGWQIDKAFEKLRTHPVFGNKALGWPEGVEDPPEVEKPEAEEREPGEDG